MTDKPIIIDGCNISNCKYYVENNGVEYQGSYQYYDMCYKLPYDNCFNKRFCWHKVIAKIKGYLDMENKQIINSVDVSGCQFIAKEDEYSSYNRVYKGQCRCSNEEMCKDHPNCFYKKALRQLDQLEADNKKLKQILTKIKEVANKVLLNTHDLELFKEADALFSALLEIHKIISEVEDDR